METRHSSPLRILAPIALVVFGVALILVISSEGGGGDGGGGGGASAAEKSKDLGQTSKSRSRTDTTSEEEKLPDRVYVVKRGDTLGGIADKTGVPVERIQDLNPGIDQFSLVAGQKIKLR